MPPPVFPPRRAPSWRASAAGRRWSWPPAPRWPARRGGHGDLPLQGSPWGLAQHEGAQGLCPAWRAALARVAVRSAPLCLMCEPEPGQGARRPGLIVWAPRLALPWDGPPPALHDGLIAQAALDSGVDRALLSAVIAVESGFRSDARSPKGALGLMQLMPATAATLLTVDNMERALVDPATNVRLGSRHLRRLLDQYPAGWIWRWRPTTRARARSASTTACRRMPKRSSM